MLSPILGLAEVITEPTSSNTLSSATIPSKLPKINDLIDNVNLPGAGESLTLLAVKALSTQLHAVAIRLPRSRYKTDIWH